MELTRKLIQEELALFETKFNESVQSRVALLDRVMRYVIKRKGKQLRPMFVFLSAKVTGAPVGESTYKAAAFVELLHTASLVHDDVVDESLERRGFFSINALWKNKIAVLVGDYLLAKGMGLASSEHDYRVLQILGVAVRQMSEGELLQMEKARNLNLKEDIYYEIIRCKTASLLSSACAAGAYSATADPELTEKMRLFGENVGMAFQIKDDLFDYGNEDIGKPTGNDIKEKKLTLPLIYTLNKMDSPTRRKMVYILRNENRRRDQVAYVIGEVVRAGGIDYAKQKMEDFRDEALKILHSLPTSPVREGLEDLVRYTTDRKY
jgi:octaprenyl-diphosphate synthase